MLKRLTHWPANVLLVSAVWIFGNLADIAWQTFRIRRALGDRVEINFELDYRFLFVPPLILTMVWYSIRRFRQRVHRLRQLNKPAP